MIKAILVIIIWSHSPNGGTTMTSQSFEVNPLAEQNAYDHCMDLAVQVKANLAKEHYDSVSATCYDVGKAD